MNYIVKKGDTLSHLANKYDVTIDDILNINPHIENRDIIKIGDELIIPEKNSNAVTLDSTPSNSEGSSNDKFDDPASNAALLKDSSSVPSATCPLQHDWFTIKPVRYSVADLDDPLKLPETLKISNSLPKLKEHKYIARKLLDHTVYLYNEEDEYLLEVEYVEGEATNSRCVFGNAPTKVINSLPILRQQKSSKIYIWLTIIPISDSLIKNLKNNPKLISEIAQKFDFSLAAYGNESDCLPLFEINKLLAEIQASEQLLKWTAFPVIPESDPNSIIVPYQAETPENHYAVCLIDPIGITTDLCREFSAAYSVALQNLAGMEHPLRMAQLTKMIIDSGIKQANDSAPIRWESASGNYSTNYSAEQIEENRKKARYSKREELEKYVNIKEMNAYLEDSSKCTSQLKKILDNLSVDWLSWLKNDLLDLSFSYFDDSTKEHVLLKEGLIAASINNIAATDNGIKLLNEWISYLFDVQDGKSKDGEKGIAAHILLSIGYLKPTLVTGTTWLYKIGDAANGNGSKENIQSTREKLYKDLRATAATETIIESIHPEIAKRVIAEGRIPDLEVEGGRFGELYDRTFYNFGMLIEDVHERFVGSKPWMDLVDLKIDYRKDAPIAGLNHGDQISFNEALEIQKSVEGIVLLEQRRTGNADASVPTVATRRTRKVTEGVRSVIKSQIFDESSLLVKPYRAVEAIYGKPYVKGSSITSFWLLQIYNACTIQDRLAKSKSKLEDFEIISDVVIGMITTALAGIDHYYQAKGITFGNKNVGLTKYLETEWADSIGQRTASKIKTYTAMASSESKMALFGESAGKLITVSIKVSLRSLPIIGSAVSFLMAKRQHEQDISSGQNGLAVGLSTTSMWLNGIGTIVSVVGLFTPLAPVAALLGLVLCVTTLGIDLLHGIFSDTPAQLLLKMSFWGTEGYKYIPELKESTVEQRKNYFQRLELPEIGREAIKNELTDFCDYLFKPQGTITEYETLNDGFNKFTAKIRLPGYIPTVTKIKLSVLGVINENHSKEILFLDMENRNRSLVHKDKVRIIKENKSFYFCFDVNERDVNFNYLKYNLNFEYMNPLRIPIKLTYDNVEIDDDNTTLLFFHDEAKFTGFQLKA